MVFVMEPLNDKTKILRPRLSVKEAGVVAVILEDFVKNHEALKNDKAMVWIRQLQRRFQHLEKQDKYLRPRR
jgi:hypothetical protein